MEPRTTLGVGKVNSLGLAPADKQQAREHQDEFTGVPYYNMANVRSSVYLSNAQRLILHFALSFGIKWDPSKALRPKQEREES